MGEKKQRELWTISDLNPISGLLEYALPERRPSIYFLSNYDEIVYVGKSINLVGRISAHRHAMRFDRVHYFTAKPHDGNWLSDIEAAFIKTIKPSFNLTTTKSPISERQGDFLKKYAGPEFKGSFGLDLS